MPSETTFVGSTGVLRRAVNAGLTNVDPAANNGWAGACPGCDIDVVNFTSHITRNGVEAKLFQNERATRPILTEAARAAWRGMKAGDLFIFYISGHGGQVRDLSGDEADGQDETICLWDGKLSDDVLHDLWEEVPAGVRVLFITDTCNSGTNFRGVQRQAKYTPKLYERTIPRSFKGQLIHFGGCADGESSYGGDNGGAFTLALLETFAPGITYRDWYNRAAAIMPRNQVPTYAEYGAVTDEFRNGEALK